MKHQYRMYAWTASHFAAKLRGYLNYKGLDYEEKRMWGYDFAVRVPRAIGTVSMPSLQVNTGEWLADTPLIIEELERRHTENSIAADTPRQRMAALLLENWFDDSWMKVSVHTRWSYPENWDNLLRQEWGKALLPFAPSFLREKLAEKTVRKMIMASMPALGIRPGKQELLERWALQHLDTLNTHFDQHDYVMGGRPTIADYACVAPHFPHLNRDPWPKREWLDPRPDLQAWVERTHGGKATNGDLLPGDEIPVTLAPVFEGIFAEFPVYIEKAVALLKRHVANKSLQSGDALPRVLGNVEFPMLDDVFACNAMVYSIWRMQRMQTFFQELTAAEQDSVNAWANQMGRADMFTMDLGPELKRNGVGAALV